MVNIRTIKMTIQEVWKIKEEKSQITKDMTAEQLRDYCANVMREFYKITGKKSRKESLSAPCSATADSRVLPEK